MPHRRLTAGIAPVKEAKDGIYALELWHGPTAAFKDMALQIMPRLLSRALVKNNEDRTALILVATSGDTGKAALEGYRDVDHIKIMVFYPWTVFPMFKSSRWRHKPEIMSTFSPSEETLTTRRPASRSSFRITMSQKN